MFGILHLGIFFIPGCELVKSGEVEFPLLLQIDEWTEHMAI